MNIVKGMYYQIIESKKFAGKVVKLMIKRGADINVMKKNGVPKAIYYQTLGGGYYMNSNINRVATESFEHFKNGVLFK